MEGAMASIEVAEVLPFARPALEIDVALVREELVKFLAGLSDGAA